MEFRLSDYDEIIREVLDSGGEFQLFPRGTSMLPLIREKRGLCDTGSMCGTSETKRYYFLAEKEWTICPSSHFKGARGWVRVVRR